MKIYLNSNKIILGLTLLTFISVFTIIFTQKIKAHPGNNSSDGCHYCWTNCPSWGEVYGERHCSGSGGGTDEPTSPTESQQGKTNGTSHANIVNLEYIRNKAKSEGDAEGHTDGISEDGLRTSGSSKLPVCNEPISYTNTPTAAYKFAFENSYRTTCLEIYSAAYDTAYDTAYNAAQSAKKDRDDNAAISENEQEQNTNESDWFIWVFYGGMASLFIGGAAWDSYGESIKKWWTKL